MGNRRGGRVQPNGEVEALNETGEILIDLLNLNDPDTIRFRAMIINTLNSIRPEAEEEILAQWLGYPDDLPNLSNRQAQNRKPEGLARAIGHSKSSNFAGQGAGELADESYRSAARRPRLLQQTVPAKHRAIDWRRSARPWSRDGTGAARPNHPGGNRLGNPDLPRRVNVANLIRVTEHGIIELE